MDKAAIDQNRAGLYKETISVNDENRLLRRINTVSLLYNENMVTKIFRYWFLVIRRSWSEVWRFLDIKGKVINALVIGTIAILMYLSNNQNSWLKEARNELTILLFVSILFMPVLTFLNTFIVPSKLHDELGGFDSLKLRLRAECEPPRYSEAWVSLRIFNDHSTKPISSCYAYIKSTISENDGTSPIKRANEKLAWSSHNPPLYGDKEIPPNENRLVDLISTLHSENRIMFTIQEANNLYKDKAYPGEYLVVVCVTGIFSGKPFEQEKVIRVTYTGDMYLSCEEII